MTLQALIFATMQLQPALNRAEAVDLAEAVESAAALSDVDEALLLALAFTESSLNRHAVNKRTGAVGLFQIHPVHLSNINPRYVADVAWNARTAAKLLREAYDRTGDWEKACARFNGRTCRSCKWSRAVLALRDKIRKQWNGVAA